MSWTPIFLYYLHYLQYILCFFTFLEKFSDSGFYSREEICVFLSFVHGINTDEVIQPLRNMFSTVQSLASRGASKALE